MLAKSCLFFVCLIPAAFALDAGTCRAIPDSKVYLSDHFSLSYPKQAKFTCLYECLGTGQDMTHEVLGTSEVLVRNESDDAFKVVCQGVKIKKTSWGYDFDRVVPFYAYETRIKELRSWAEDFVSKNNPLEFEKLKKLKKDLLEVVDGYRQASRSGVPSSSSFGKASRFLEKVSDKLPQSPELLDDSLSRLRSEDILLPEDELANQFASDVLLNLAYWR